jgi:Xaa-Pro aminopeptidase
MRTRLEQLRRQIIRTELDALLISQADNRRYTSGFTGSAGFLIISQQTAILATDFRYVEQAKAEAPEFEVVKISDGLIKWFPDIASSLGASKLGFEESGLSFSFYKELTAAIGESGIYIDLVPTTSLVESLRAVKDEAELGYIKEAAELADAALEEVLPGARPGISEKKLAWELESYMRQNGSESLPFDVIVASGPNSALPHAKPTDRVIGPNEPVIIDLGAKVAGYASDISRTICLGQGDNTFQRIYDIVLGAQLTAISTLQAGMSGEQADKLGRTVIDQAGYDEAFGHGLGHGIGLSAHEEPRLGPGSSSILSDSMVFTVEPGVYIPGWGGIRIEDMVMLEGGKPQLLTKAMKIWR